jgi:hypothetical protein
MERENTRTMKAIVINTQKAIVISTQSTEGMFLLTSCIVFFRLHLELEAQLLTRNILMCFGIFFAILITDKV